MDTQPQTVLSEPINARLPLTQPGGAVDISAVGPTAITDANAKRIPYLMQLEALCLTAGTTVGDFQLRDGAGTLLTLLRQPVAVAVVGTRYVWWFPHPWKGSAINTVFQVQYSVNTLGTWRWNANGFYSAT